MKSVGIVALDKASFFDDDGEIGDEYRPYVAKAARLGIVNGDFTGSALLFRPNEPITRYEAARILTALSGKVADEEALEYFTAKDAPVFAREATSFVYSLGLLDTGEDVRGALTRKEAAVMLNWLFNSDANV